MTDETNTIQNEEREEQFRQENERSAQNENVRNLITHLVDNKLENLKEVLEKSGLSKEDVSISASIDEMAGKDPTEQKKYIEDQLNNAFKKLNIHPTAEADCSLDDTQHIQTVCQSLVQKEPQKYVAFCQQFEDCPKKEDLPSKDDPDYGTKIALFAEEMVAWQAKTFGLDTRGQLGQEKTQGQEEDSYGVRERASFQPQKNSYIKTGNPLDPWKKYYDDVIHSGSPDQLYEAVIFGGMMLPLNAINHYLDFRDAERKRVEKEFAAALQTNDAQALGNRGWTKQDLTIAMVEVLKPEMANLNPEMFNALPKTEEKGENGPHFNTEKMTGTEKQAFSNLLKQAIAQDLAKGDGSKITHLFEFALKRTVNQKDLDEYLKLAPHVQAHGSSKILSAMPLRPQANQEKTDVEPEPQQPTIPQPNITNNTIIVNDNDTTVNINGNASNEEKKTPTPKPRTPGLAKTFERVEGYVAGNVTKDADFQKMGEMDKTEQQIYLKKTLREFLKNSSRKYKDKDTFTLASFRLGKGEKTLGSKLEMTLTCYETVMEDMLKKGTAEGKDFADIQQQLALIYTVRDNLINNPKGKEIVKKALDGKPKALTELAGQTTQWHEKVVGLQAKSGLLRKLRNGEKIQLTPIRSNENFVLQSQSNTRG